MSSSKWVGEPDLRIEQRGLQMLGTPVLRLQVALVLGGTALCANKTSSGAVSVAQWHSGTVVAPHGVEIKMSDENLPRCHLASISISA